MYKVLLVDDEILVREAISAKIEWGHLGFELVIAKMEKQRLNF